MTLICRSLTALALVGTIPLGSALAEPLHETVAEMQGDIKALQERTKALVSIPESLTAIHGDIKTLQERTKGLERSQAAAATDGADLEATTTTPWGFEMRLHETKSSFKSDNRNRVFLKRAWSGNEGDYTYLGSTGNRSNTEQAAIWLTAKRGIRFGKGTNDGATLSDTHAVIDRRGLDVMGAIRQRGRELHADYVFQPGYELESIEDHAEYMWNEQHLEAVPKGRVDENGLEVVEIGARSKGMLEELEKAHIYIAELNRAIKEQRQMIERQQVDLDQLKHALAASDAGRATQRAGGV